MTTNDDGSAPDERAQLLSKLQAEDHHLTKAILTAFEQTDWDELERLVGDRTLALARLAAGAAWIEQKRGELPNEEARRHREAQHRAALSIVENHRPEWRELIRTHRIAIDAERDGPDAAPAPVSTPAQQTVRQPGGLLARIRNAAARRRAG
jgi:hypothetical protein